MPLPRRYEVSHEVAFSRAQVWELLAQTDQFNRHIGLNAVVYGKAKTDEFGVYRAASTRVGGLQMQWREYMFRWEQHRHYTVMRRYERGPLVSFEGGLELEELGADRTRLTLWSRLEARGQTGRALAPLIARQLIKRSIRYCRKVFIEGAPPPRPQAPPPRPREWNRMALESGIARLRALPVRDDYALQLREFIRTAGADEAAALRPFEWADEHEFDRHEALRTCLYAVRVGLLNLRWAMMCPNCRVSKSEVSSLSQVGETVHCDLCGVSYDLNFDRYVELRFSVHPSVRAASSDIYCVGGPFRSPHVLEQHTIGAGQCQHFQLPPNVPVRLRVVGLNHGLDVDESDGGGCFVLSDEGWMKQDVLRQDVLRQDVLRQDVLRDETSGQTSMSAGLQLCAANKTALALAVVLEKRDWDDKAVTAARVTALQEFRDLFSSEVLAPGRQVAVENVTIFFSDLSNSTALYESIGDAPAFSRVGSHFEFINKNIEVGGGAIVKTMGDAVMAVFNRPEEAVATALRVQREFRYFAETLTDKGDITLKIGLHCGSVLAVNSNDRLDYFGRTVNLAARTVGVADGGDVVITGDVWNCDEVKAVVARHQLQPLHFQTQLRGVEATRELVRLKP